jgi:hypothetical protein
VHLAGRPFPKIADVIGVMLEQNGLTNLKTAKAAFSLPAGTAFEAAPDSLSEYLREHPMDTDYALFAEFLGNREGFTEVRGIVVDKAGRLVWLDRQTPDDAAFKRHHPDCPMTCCVLLVERLGTAIEFNPDAAPQEGEGKFSSKLMRESGLPDKAERNAIKPRLETLKKAGPDAAVLVYPALVNNETDRKCGEHLAAMLNEGGLCRAKLAEAEPRFKPEPGPDEQKRLWDVARAFQDYVRDNPPETEYALYADYLFSPRTKAAHAVHFIICDRAGDWIIVDFQNSHWEDFQSIDPKTRDDCNRLVVRRLEGYVN